MRKYDWLFFGFNCGMQTLKNDMGCPMSENLVFQKLGLRRTSQTSDSIAPKCLSKVHIGEMIHGHSKLRNNAIEST